MLVNHLYQRMEQMGVNARRFGPKQIHALCLKQQKQIMNQVVHHSFDIFRQITKVCPNQPDFRMLPSEEVNIRINSYTSYTHFQHMASPNLNQNTPNCRSSQKRASESKVSEFCPIEQSNYKNFLEDVHESPSIWDEMNEQFNHNDIHNY